jgi:aldehyde dehydrogenase family 7 protein A1
MGGGEMIESVSPHSGEVIGKTQLGSGEDYNACVEAMNEEKKRWMAMPAPARGEIVRQIGEALREKKVALGSLLALEVGKI